MDFFLLHRDAISLAHVTNVIVKKPEHGKETQGLVAET